MVSLMSFYPILKRSELRLREFNLRLNGMCALCDLRELTL